MDSRVFLKVCVLVAGVALFSGCGGDSSSSSTTTTSTTPTTPTTPSVTGIVSQIQFTLASPASIAIQGVGLPATSKLTFTLVDVDGGVVSGATVTFSLNTSVGGITLSTASATSDSAGVVTTTVNAGSVSTSVRVRAELSTNAAIYAQSDNLVISTGLADQDSFTIAANPWNPEGMDVNGITSTISVWASDHFNNPVPDGAVVYFHTEGGAITPSCIMAGGTCTATWTSTNPKPDDGKVTITATMQGEESFSDSNGNGILDDGEYYGDLGEVIYDYNFNSAFDPAVPLSTVDLGTYYESFRDFDGNGTYDGPDGQYNGVKCNPANTGIYTCSTQTSVDARRNIEIVMSASDGSATFSSNPLDLTGVTSGTIQMTAQDSYGNALPAGTTVKLTASSSNIAVSPASFTVPSHRTGPSQWDITVTKSATAPAGTDTINVELTTPYGIISTGGSLTVNH